MSRKLPTNIANFTKNQIENFLKEIQTIFCDCDGVLWRGMNVLRKSDYVINRFLEMNKKVYFVTNNSTRTREELADKARQLNFKVGTENIISTAYLAAKYLQEKNFTKKVYVIGSPGITKELDAVGIKHYGVGPDILSGPIASLVTEQYKDPDVGAVIVGFDEHISFPKLMKAASYLDDKSTLFLATNTDERFPMPNYILPGTGTFVRAIETCSERKAIIMGKPESYLCDVFFKNEIKEDGRKFLMVGDRLNTDIIFGKNNNLQTLFVESGVHTLQDVQNVVEKLEKGADDADLENQIPDYYISTLGDLLDKIE